MSTASVPLSLDYAPYVPVLRRRRVRAAILALAVLTFSLWAWKRGPATWRDLTYRYADYRCANHDLPPDQVVYEEDPARAAELLRKPGYVSLPRSTRTAAVAYYPRAWDDLLRHTMTGPRPFIRSNPEGLLFLHERRSKSGNRRIVAVHIDGGTLPSASLNNLIGFEFPYVVLPAAKGQAPTLRAMFPMCGTGRVYPEATAKLSPIRFYAGQPDPNDESRFTIAYELPEGRGTIDGQLMDTDFVNLVVRDGPAKDRYMLYES